MKRRVGTAILLTLVAVSFRFWLAFSLPPDDDDDGHFYSRIAHNLLEHRGYSGEEEEPFVPTYVRAPGYPLVLAGIYAVARTDNQLAVRVVQVIVDTLTCWLIALLALAWAPREWELAKRRRAMLIALALAASCPFTAIYVTTILTEAWANASVIALSLIATLALRAKSSSTSAWLWLVVGFIGGAATMFRPDCALFAAGAALMLVSVAASRFAGSRSEHRPRILLATTVSCIALVFGFAAVLAPWTIRNVRVFGVFQPVAPPHANQPDEFAPLGYIAWLRTWVDDERYVSPVEDALDLYPIDLEKIPDSAFDSPDERERVASLLDQYNNAAKPVAASDAEGDTSDAHPSVKMTAEIDAAFGDIARERIARHPLRYYFTLPLKRAASLWFDTHSQYYPFDGELFPSSDLDEDTHQQYWLPFFALLTWLYTIIAAGGAWLMLKSESARRWIALLGLMIIPRLVFLSFQEHPEARYTVEFFALILAVGGVALAELSLNPIRNVLGRKRSQELTSSGGIE